jgi:hypothetical protein
MRVTSIIAFITVFMTSFNLYGQESPARVAFYTEGAGTGFSLISVHGEILISESTKQNEQIRASIGIGGADMGHGSIPVYLKSILFGPENWLEIGAGITYIHTFVEGNPIFPTSAGRVYPGMIFGYRQQDRLGGFLFRLTFNPKVDIDGREILFGAGMSLGWAF